VFDKISAFRKKKLLENITFSTGGKSGKKSVEITVNFGICTEKLMVASVVEFLKKIHSDHGPSQKGERTVYK